jgi:hydrogenase nickel incorporation protein HypA/HybF
VHEFSIVQALMDRVEHEARAHNATRVQRVCVKIGDLSGVELDLLTTAYLTSRGQTLCAHAPLEVAAIRPDWRCRLCGAPVPHGGLPRCRSCGGPAKLVAGDEILLERIELEVEQKTFDREKPSC